MRLFHTFAIGLVTALCVLHGPSTDAATAADRVWTAEELDRAISALKRIDSPDLPTVRIEQLEQRLATGDLSKNDKNLLCIGALSAPFAITFGIGVVPNPPWDYILGQLPAYASNLALKFCPAELIAPSDFGVHPNVDTDAGSDCAYDFTQAIISGNRGDFMGLPLQVLGDWTFNASDDSVGFGTPTVFHYNTDVDVRMLLPSESPFGYFSESPDPDYIAKIGPFGIEAPSLEPFDIIGCLLDGSVAESLLGSPCPIDLDRKIRLPVGRHTIRWRAETSVELLDTLPPIYVPGKPPGSRKELAKQVLKRVYETAREDIAGEFLEMYPTGVVSIATQQVDVYDTTIPVLSFDPPSNATFRIEAQEPGGQSTRGLRQVLRDSVVATDSCNVTPQVTAPIAPFLALGTHQIEWTASDAGPNESGGINSASIAQTIIVEDTQPPQIAPPPPVVVEVASAPTAVDIGSPLVFDVVDLEPVIENDAPASFPFGTTIVQWRATDASGNASGWVDQSVTVKALGSNNPPVAANAAASGLSFEEISVPLSASDADGDDLFFYIDRRPDEGSFVAPLLPVFVDDLRVQRQVTIEALEAICASTGGPLPAQDFIYIPKYITVNDDGISYVIDRELVCSGSSLVSQPRIARFGPDGALLSQYRFPSPTAGTTDKLSFHAGGLPGFEAPFIYWVNTDTRRLVILNDDLSGSEQIMPLNLLPGGTIALNDEEDAAIDLNGLLFVTNNIKVYVFDLLTRGTSNEPEFLERLGRPASVAAGDFGNAWDMDVDSDGSIYVSDFSRDRIHKFSPSHYDRDSGQFTSGDYLGWMGRCDTDLAAGSAAACDVANGRSIGYSCNDDDCGVSSTSGALPGQFNEPQGIAINPNGILYVADRSNGRVQRFSPEGFFAGQAKSDCESVNCFVIGQFGVAEDVSVNSNNFYVLDNNTDILHIFSANPVTMTGPTTGTVTYRSNNNYIGTDTFEFFASDGLRVDGELVASNVATASVDVDPNQRQPFATPGLMLETQEDTSADVMLDGSDPDIGDSYPWEPLETLSMIIAEQPAHGVVTLVNDVATYTPDADFNGIDSFSYQVDDGTFVSDPETVVVAVLPENDAPILRAPTDPQDLRAGRGFEFDISIGLIDPDEMDAHSLVLNWGDGSVETEGTIDSNGDVTGPLIDYNAGGDGVISASHIYANTGPESIQACVADAANAVGCTSFDIDVIDMTDLALIDVGGQTEVAEGQVISYILGISNYEPELGAGISATEVALIVELDPRTIIVNVAGAACTTTGSTIECAIADLTPISRGPSDGPPTVDRQVIITALPDGLMTGTSFLAEATLSATQPNRNEVTEMAIERHVVANADFTVSSYAADSHNANPGNGLCADADGICSLRAAIEEANALGGTRSVALSAALYRLDLGPLTIDADISILGNGQGRSELISDTAEPLFEVDTAAALTIRDITLTGSERVAGTGGLINSSGSLLIEDALLQNGQASTGGAVFSDGDLTIRRSALMFNQASGSGLGGAISNFGSAMLENVLLYGNSANAGGAIQTDPGSGATLTIAHSTIVSNSAGSIGPGIFGNFSSAVAATLTSTIVSGNRAVQTSPACWSQLASGGNNIINDPLDGCSFATQAGDQLDTAPRLQPLVFSQLGRPTMPPAEDSPALDQGSTACPANDLRRMPRPQGGLCDTGAYEAGTGAKLAPIPEVLDFGQQAAGTSSAPQNLLLENVGNLSLAVTDLRFPGAPFAMLADDCPPAPFELAVGDSCTLNIVFSPNDDQAANSELLIETNTLTSPDTVSLQGNVAEAAMTVSDEWLVFADQAIGVASTPMVLQITSSGNADLEIGQLSIAGSADGDFSIAPGQDSCSNQSLPPGSTCTVGVIFTPSEPGIRRAWMEIPSNDPLGTQTVALLGTNDVVFFSSFDVDG